MLPGKRPSRGARLPRRRMLPGKRLSTALRLRTGARRIRGHAANRTEREPAMPAAALIPEGPRRHRPGAGR